MEVVEGQAPKPTILRPGRSTPLLTKIASNWVKTAVAILVIYFVTPFSINVLGEEVYGTWLLIASLAGYMGLLAMGAPIASVRYIAKYAAEDNQDDLAKTVATFLSGYFIMAGSAMIIGIILVVLFPYIWEVPDNLRVPAQIAMALATLYWAITLLMHWPRGILSAFREFPQLNLAAVGGLLFRLVLTFGLLTIWPTIITIGLTMVFSTLGEMLILLFILKRRHPSIKFSVRKSDKGMVKEISSFSVYTFALSLGGQITHSTDAFVIGSILGVGVIPFFAVAKNLLTYVRQITWAIATVVQPTASLEFAQGGKPALRITCMKWTKVSYSIALLFAGPLLVIGPNFIGWWISPEYTVPAGNVLRIIMSSLLILLPFRSVGQPMLVGIGKPREATYLFLASAFINVIISILLAKPFGLVGVATGTAVQNLLVGTGLFFLISYELELSKREFLGYVFGKATLGGLAYYGVVRLAAEQWDTTNFMGMFAVGLCGLVVYGVIWLLFVYRNDKLMDLTRFKFWRRSSP
jgi:O-antigen/teichoic acid export membrane protein